VTEKEEKEEGIVLLNKIRDEKRSIRVQGDQPGNRRCAARTKSEQEFKEGGGK